MTEIPIDRHYLACLSTWTSTHSDPPIGIGVDPNTALAYFEAQARSRHTDFAARWLQSQGEGFYTISSAGHESNAAIAMAMRPTDPALLHYRSGGFYMARAAQVPGSTPVRDILLGVAAGIEDPISGGRHKVFGHHGLNIIPQTSTIGSHLPRAVGVAFALGRGRQMRSPLSWPEDAVVAVSFGDASANHSTVTGALNAAAYIVHRGEELPLLVVCEDNGIGISTKTAEGWTAAALRRYPEFDHLATDGADAVGALLTARTAVDGVRMKRRPCVLHLRTVRFLGHAGSDFELAYRSRSEVEAEYARDPLLSASRLLLDSGILGIKEIRDRYELARLEANETARDLCGVRRLDSAAAVLEPLTRVHPDAVEASAQRRPPNDFSLSRPQKEGAQLCLAEAINATLGDVLAVHPEAMIFGEDVARKGGVYGVTRGLRKRFGPSRVFDTLLDEQTILGIGLGAAVSGLLPIPEIQYLAYLHNAEDQLRGEAATLAFFSAGRYTNGMVVRIAGLAYQKGFGGHFHNDNSVAVLRDIPGLVLAVPSNAGDAPGMLRACVALAAEEGRVCVFLEPIALYHVRDLHTPGDGLWSSPWGGDENPTTETVIVPGEVKTYLHGKDILLITFGNGVPMSLRAARQLALDGVDCTVMDLRWLSPLPEGAVVSTAERFNRVLVVDETRKSGGVSESVLALLRDNHYSGTAGRITSADSFIPLGPAANRVLLCEEDVVGAAKRMLSP